MRFQATATRPRLGDGNRLWTLVFKCEFVDEQRAGVNNAGIGHGLGEVEIGPGRHERPSHDHERKGELEKLQIAD